LGQWDKGNIMELKKLDARLEIGPKRILIDTT